MILVALGKSSTEDVALAAGNLLAGFIRCQFGVTTAGFDFMTAPHSLMRLTLAIALFMIAADVASAETEITRRMMAMSETARNAAWTNALRESGETCDQVVRTLFQYANATNDSWNVGCQDGNTYSISVYADLNAKIIIISCKKLDAIMTELARRGGKDPRKESQACWVKY
jgi:hypothetical protein